MTNITRRDFSKLALVAPWCGLTPLNVQESKAKSPETLPGSIIAGVTGDPRDWADFLRRVTPSVRRRGDFESIGRKLFLVVDCERRELPSDYDLMETLGAPVAFPTPDDLDNEEPKIKTIKMKFELQICDAIEFDDIRIFDRIQNDCRGNREVISGPDITSLIDEGIEELQSRGMAVQRILVGSRTGAALRKIGLADSYFQSGDIPSLLLLGYIGWFRGIRTLRSRWVDPDQVYICASREYCGRVETYSPLSYYLDDMQGEGFKLPRLQKLTCLSQSLPSNFSFLEKPGYVLSELNQITAGENFPVVGLRWQCQDAPVRDIA